MRQQPNVVLCCCDQLRAFDIGCYGNEVVHTPNIDRLAASGVCFETAVTNNPVCTPARSILLSGQYNRHCTGSLSNDADTPPCNKRNRLIDITLPEVFRANGYDTGVIGKWHLHPHPLTVGFDTAFYPRHNHRYTKQTFLRDWSDEFPIDGYTPDIELAEVDKFLSSHQEKPFFLFYNISQPHMPLCDAPDKYLHYYHGNDIPLRVNVWQDGKLAFDENWFKIYCWDFIYYMLHDPKTTELPEGFDLHQLTALYYGLISWADEQLGQLMHLLQEKGLAENTLVIFTADHGDNLGSHQLFNKDHLIEEGLRIPLIFSWPGKLPSLHIDSQVASLIDLMPTMLALAGILCPKCVEGSDLSSVVTGLQEEAGENLAYIETSSGEIGIRTPRFLFGMHMDGNVSDQRPLKLIEGNEKLSDLLVDPYELRNVIDDLPYQHIADELRTKLRNWDAITPWLDISQT